jgi:class 3 adenylate cyclase
MRLLEAIGESVAASAAPTLAEPKPPDTAERRQVTVMFSDLVGSTALSARLDPEDLQEVISSYQKCVANTVQRFGGFVAKYMGDGVLVYIGYPAERAVRAAFTGGFRAEERTDPCLLRKTFLRADPRSWDSGTRTLVCQASQHDGHHSALDNRQLQVPVLALLATA